jgi:hypothetical protein
MRPPRLCLILLVLAWGLWCGGIVMVFIAVTSIFSTFAPDRTVAGTAAAGVFRRFETYQLVLAAVAVVSAALLWRKSDRPGAGARAGLLALLVLAGVLALASTFAVSRRIHALRIQGLTQTDEFRRLHGISMAVYATEAVVLLVAGVMLPRAIAVGGSPTSSGEANPPAPAV